MNKKLKFRIKFNRNKILINNFKKKINLITMQIFLINIIICKHKNKRKI